MSLLVRFGLNTIPDDMRNATFIVGTGAALTYAEPLRAALEARLGRTRLAAPVDTGTPLPEALPLPRSPTALTRILRRAAPTRIVLLGEIDTAATIAQSVTCPIHWVNAPADALARFDALPDGGTNITRLVSDPRLCAGEADVHLSGDPLLGIETLPAATDDRTICERFRDHRQAGRWIGYFAATGEGEEALAYGAFFQLTRRKMGLMVLAPHDPARYEPVYRDAIKYHLPTNRHNRLSTSFVPIKSRVYYIEDPETLAAMYRCADFVVAGGTLSADARHAPDVLGPICAGAPVIVGTQTDDPIVVAATRDGAAIAVADEDALVDATYRLLEDNALRAARIEQAAAWANAQAGALDRVVDMIAQAP